MFIQGCPSFELRLERHQPLQMKGCDLLPTTFGIFAMVW